MYIESVISMYILLRERESTEEFESTFHWLFYASFRFAQLNTHEMLAEVFLTCHNQHVFLIFLHSIRRAIAENTLPQFTAAFRKARQASIWGICSPYLEMRCPLDLILIEFFCGFVLSNTSFLGSTWWKRGTGWNGVFLLYLCSLFLVFRSCIP